MARRVRHWQSGTMILRWSAAGMLEAERSFRKVAGYRSLAKLDVALRAHDAALDRGLIIEGTPPKRLCSRYSIPTAIRAFPRKALASHCRLSRLGH